MAWLFRGLILSICNDFPLRCHIEIGFGAHAASLYLTKHHAMKIYLGEWRYSSTHSLTSVLVVSVTSF